MIHPVVFDTTATEISAQLGNLAEEDGVKDSLPGELLATAVTLINSARLFARNPEGREGLEQLAKSKNKLDEICCISEIT